MTDEQATKAPETQAPAVVDAKKPWQSKTIWITAITALAPLAIPGASQWIASNPELFSGVLGALFAFLRLVSSDKISIS